MRYLVFIISAYLFTSCSSYRKAASPESDAAFLNNYNKELRKKIKNYFEINQGLFKNNTAIYIFTFMKSSEMNGVVNMSLDYQNKPFNKNAFNQLKNLEKIIEITFDSIEDYKQFFINYLGENNAIVQTYSKNSFYVALYSMTD